MASLLWRQVSILLYRNFHFKLRTKSQSIQEIALPIYFVVLLVILKLFAYKPTSFPELPNETNASLSSFPLANNTVFYVAPDFSEAERVVNRTLPGSTYRMFSSLADMDNAYKSTPNPNGSPAIGIYFTNERDVMEYALRFPYSGFPSSVLFSYSETSCRNEQDSFSSIACPANQYLSTGFASLQVMLDTEIIKMYNENYSSPEVIIQRMPKPGTVSNGLVFKIVTSLYLVLAMSPFLTFLLVNVVTEKQRKIREAMKMMGLDNLALWLSWSITYSTMILVMTLVMTLISVFGQLFPKSNFLLVFLIYFFYGLSVEMLGFMLTTFLNNARTSGAVGSFLSLILGLLYFIIAFGNINVQGAWALSLLSPTGFAIGIDQLSQLELTADGAQFYNLWEGPYPLAISLIMLPVDTFLYFLLTLYLDIVIPGEYGQRQPFYFFLLPSFWFPSKYGKLTTQVDIQSCQVNEDIESISDDLKGKEAIKIKNISKLYEKRIFSDNTKSTLAVNKFSLDIYEGQITALLGHNGAGKTTLFNILTGFVDATSGSATVFNYDVSNTSHMAKIRQMTGVCPQHNILIDVLSVKEHLKIFAGIKGIHPSKVDNEITRVVKLIGLEDQMDTFSKNLSGGQKRKLSVGIAIMGDPKILILDEPTAGMDPYSRHSLWDLLRSRKEGKVTLLTTHFMDEADILADRKAIISKGQLRCVGSSLFLKTRYGAGYHLGVVTKVAGDNSSVTSCVKKHIGGAELVRSSGFELGYTLPIVEVDKFADLFGDLEKDSDELGIQNFGVSMTTLEEVFLKIGEEDEVEDAPTPDENGTKAPLLSSSSAIRERYSSTTAVCYVNPNFKNKDQEREAIEIDIANNCGFDPTISKVGEPSKLRTYFALVKKQAIVYTRNPGIIVFGLLFPIGLAIGSAAVLNLQIQTDNSDDPPLVPLSLQLNSLYASPTSPFLYKNSTGQPLDNFANISGVSFQLSDLNDFLTVPDRFSYTAADIFQFNSTQMSFKALYNTTAVHSLPSVLNLMSQSVLSTINQTASLITTYNKRWPALTPQSAFNGGLFGGTLMAALAVVLSSGLSAINPVQERELKIKSQLRVSGVQFNLYWLAPLFVDYLWYLCIAIAFLIGLGAFGVSAFITGGALAALILLLVGCGFSCIFTSYCASFIFDKYETASSVWPTIIQLVSLFPYLIVSLVDQLGSPDIAIVFNAIFVLINPYYVAFSGIFYISKVYTKYVTMNSADNIPASVYFDWSYPMIPLSVLMPYIHVVILYWLLKVIDVKHSGGKISDVFNTGKKRHDATVRDTSMFEPEEENGIDDDVLEESRKVKEIVNNQTYNQHEPVVLIHNLRKEYVKRKEKKFFQKQKEEEKVKVAVSNLSLSVYPGDVLGLLGPNGAGKTTAMNVLIAETGPTKGKVFVSGHNVQSSLSKAFQGMGYCSQDNPLWEVLTIREHLTLFAVARGVTNIQPTIDSYVDALDIREHLDKRAKTLSGGTKRKLCFAMALLGNPQVVLLDEPSTGMDPKTKRFMWNTISSAFQGTNRGAILTTHYMDEADALCSKVAIMVLGKLKCIGSTQHLKSKFGQGYILEIKMKRLQEAGDDSLHRFICEMFQSVSEPERFSHRYVYKVAQDSVVSLSSVFGELEQAKESLGIEEYSFSQSTLEQVFLQFAREQEEREDERETT